jgi:hypothetical protein
MAYDALYLIVIFVIFCLFVTISIILYKKRPTLRLAVGSLFLGEVLILVMIHRIAYIVASFGVGHVVFEFVIFLYRFFGFGINLWVLVFFWGRKDVYDEGFDEIETINSGTGTVENPAENQVFEQI